MRRGCLPYLPETPFCLLPGARAPLQLSPGIADFGNAVVTGTTAKAAWNCGDEFFLLASQQGTPLESKIR